MSEQVSETEVFEATPEVVFGAFTAWGGHPASEMKDAEILDGAQHEAATVRYQMSAFGASIKYTVRYQTTPNTLVTFDLVESPMLKAMHGEFTLEPISDGMATKCNFLVSIEPSFPVPRMLKRRAAKTIVNNMLLSLHHYVHDTD